jgi:hypothetical protein
LALKPWISGRYNFKMESKKFKYMFGEPTYSGNKSTFDGINTPDGTVEGNAICANEKFIAVSDFNFPKFDRCHGKLEVEDQ